ncbi:15012_t:CDS:2 [Cetraspora pellucida]|uniref:15012_t:CDS:1 n=1 Tax=Cetraspora pellucida TaxID=1433469 RepID=A0A9N9AMA4_9GLOM|nr:15012_t:CDS:2 [Cetraspora pellucida]
MCCGSDCQGSGFWRRKLMCRESNCWINGFQRSNCQGKKFQGNENFGEIKILEK